MPDGPPPLPASPTGHVGGCLCGAIRYRVDAQPLTVYACHCTDCQRRTGSAFALSMILPRNAVQLTAGTPVSYRAELADGRVKQGRMCAACGTRLWGEPARRPNIAVLQPGTLDDPRGVTPVAHIWTRSAVAWFVFPEGVPIFETEPEDPLELVRLWRRAHGSA